MSTNQNKTIMINESSSYKTVYIKVGQELLVSLPTNPSTGYSWSIETLPDFLSIIEPEQVINPAHDTKLVGVPATSVWRYKVEKSGSGTLQLDYQRSWEDSSPPAKVFSCQIIAN